MVLLTPSTVDARNVNSREIVHCSFANFVVLENFFSSTSDVVGQSTTDIGLYVQDSYPVVDS